MKGRFLRKALAASLALLIVTGSAPIKPISNVFESMVVTAEAVDEVTKEFSNSNIKNGSTGQLTYNDELFISATGNETVKKSNSSGQVRLIPSINNEGAVEEGTVRFYPHISGKVKSIVFSSAYTTTAGGYVKFGKGSTWTNSVSETMSGNNPWRSISFTNSDGIQLDNEDDYLEIKLFGTADDGGGIISNGSITVTYEPTSSVQTHTHNFSYSQNGSTLTATCAHNDGMDCSLASDNWQISTTLTPPTHATYAPNVSHPATLSNIAGFTTETGATAGDITYVNNTTSENLGTSSPHDVGAYTASVTINAGGTDYTLTTSFRVGTFSGINTNYPQFTTDKEGNYAIDGETVTITFTPQYGETLNSLSVKGETTNYSLGNGITKVDDTHYTFIMPAETVTIDASFTYNISIDNTIQHGSVTASVGTTENATTATNGDTVILNVTPETGYTTKSVSVNGTAIEPVEGVYSFTMPAKNVTVTAEFKRVFSDNIGENLAGYSISLQGDIGVNFYMELDESIVNSDTAYMQFTLPNGTAPKVMVKDVKSNAQTVGGKTYYVFKCNVSAKEMASEIKAQIIDGDKAGTEYTYSVKDYADYLLAHTAEKADYAAAAPLVKAMLNYGANSQTYFGVEGTLANAGLDDADKVLGDVTIEHSTPVISALPEGVTFEGASLSLKSETTLSLFFKNTSGDPVTFKYGSDEITAVDNNGYLQVTITGIKAKQLSSDFTITVGDSGSVTYSPMNYCKTVLEGEYPDNLKNVVKALYKYSQEADSYFTT